MIVESLKYVDRMKLSTTTFLGESIDLNLKLKEIAQPFLIILVKEFFRTFA